MTETTTDEDIRTITGAEAMTFADSRVGKGKGYCIEDRALPTDTLGRIHAIAADTFGAAAVEFGLAGEETIQPWAYLLRLSALLVQTAELAAVKPAAKPERAKPSTTFFQGFGDQIVAPATRMVRSVERDKDGRIARIIDEQIEP